MVFNKEYEYTLINDNISVDDLRNYCEKYSINVNLSDSTGRWFAFCNWYGHNNDLTIWEASSFGYIMSLFVTGVGVSCGTSSFFREKNIEEECSILLDDLLDDYDDDVSVLREFFKQVFALYHDDIERFSFKNKSLNLRVSDGVFTRFMRVPGDNRASKFNFLMDFYKKNNG